MKLVITGVTIADPNSPFNQNICDVRVDQGKLVLSKERLNPAPDEDVIDGTGCYLSPGFFDLNCAIGDPGFETREDLQTAAKAAQAGGFTGIAVLPHTAPVVHPKAEIEYILNRSRNNLVDVYPIGAISKDLEGKDLAELYDMQLAGAVAFSDGNKPVSDDGFMSRAMQYAKGIDALLMLYPENKSIAGKAQVNESSTSVLLGMKGIPALAEQMQISRDLFLAQYHDSAVHISTISTAGSVALIKKAKADGLKVSCDVAVHQLVFTEDQLNDFDSNYKVKPPLRSQADLEALIEGLRSGTIDAVTSQHRPHEIEHKDVEFEIAAYGMLGLQTTLPLMVQAGFDAQEIAEKLSLAPRRILNLDIPVIDNDAVANFTVYNLEETWRYDAASNHSKSRNSPLLNQQLTGKVKLICNNNKFEIYG